MALPSVTRPVSGEPSGARRFSRSVENAPRRILAVAPQPFYQDRGTPIALRQVLQAASELGYQVDLLTFPVGTEVHLPGLRIFRTGNPLGIRSVPIGLSLRKLALDASLVRALRARLAQETYTCVHALEEAAWPALVLARRHRIPLLYDMQSSLPEQLLAYRLARVPPAPMLLREAERWILARADLVVASAGLGDRVRHLSPGTRVREWRFPSTPSEVSTFESVSLRRQLGLPQDAPIVLYSGSFESYQGLDDLIAAIPAVLAAMPQARFVLVGADRAGGDSLGGEARELMRAGILTVVDRQPRSAMPVYLAMADVLVSPRAFGGNLPLKIFDYLAAGRPIVATDISTHRAVLTQHTAVLVQPNADALADGIVSVLRCPSKARELGAAARRYALQHLGWSRFVSTVDQIYEDAHRRVPA
jgi:glycosyltransferase involved in cell wall biosynthesis